MAVQSLVLKLFRYGDWHRSSCMDDEFSSSEPDSLAAVSSTGHFALCWRSRLQPLRLHPYEFNYSTLLEQMARRGMWSLILRRSLEGFLGASHTGACILLYLDVRGRALVGRTNHWIRNCLALALWIDQ